MTKTTASEADSHPPNAAESKTAGRRPNSDPTAEPPQATMPTATPKNPPVNPAKTPAPNTNAIAAHNYNRPSAGHDAAHTPATPPTAEKTKNPATHVDKPKKNIVATTKPDTKP